MFVKSNVIYVTLDHKNSHKDNFTFKLRFLHNLKAE